MPALSKARDHAKRIICSANLRSLGMAAMYYADDNDGLTPSSTNSWNNGGVTRGGWVGRTSDNSNQALAFDVQVYGNGGDEFTGLYKGQLWDYINNTEGWRCSTDQDREQLRSYCMSAQWWGIHTRTYSNTPHLTVWYDPGPKVYKKFDTLKYPSQRFLFIDGLGYNRDAYFAIWYNQSMWWNMPSINHGGGSVNAYSDGHVEYYKMEDETINMVEEGLLNLINGFRMPQVSVPDSEDLKYYQRATWGELGWKP